MIIKNLCAIAAALILCGCSTMQSIKENTEKQHISMQEHNNKIVEIMSDPELDILRFKTALIDGNGYWYSMVHGSSEITLRMLANSEFVSEEDKVALIFYSDKRRQAEQIFYDFLQKWEGENAVGHAKTTNGTYGLFLTKLYNRELRWGDFNTITAQLYGRLSAALEEIHLNGIQEKIAANETRNENIGKALFIFSQGVKDYGEARYGPAVSQNLTNIINSTPKSTYQAPKTTNCTFYGNRVSCVSN